MRTRAACDVDFHKRLKLDAHLWARETEFLGLMYGVEPNLELANCNRCGSTLSRPVIS